MARKRSRTTALSHLLDRCPQPAYALDTRREIVYANSALASWLGADLEQLIGARCDYHSLPEEDAIARWASALCPPPEVFQGRTRDGCLDLTGVATGESGPEDERGGTVRSARFIAIDSDEPQEFGVLVLVGEEIEQRVEVGDAERLPEQLHQQLQALRSELAPNYGLQRYAGSSAVARRVRSQAQVAIREAENVLIAGPAGSGRAHLARTIHAHRPASPLIPLDCKVVDGDLIESTVAALLRDVMREGMTTASLLLQDVDQLSQEAQAVLLGVLSVEEFDLLTLSTATLRQSELLQAEAFDDELACELTTISIEIPALHQRREDLSELVQLLVEDWNTSGDRQLGGCSPEALDQLAAYAWPGDVAELKQVIQESCRRADGPLLEAGDLPERLGMQLQAEAGARRPIEPIALDQVLADVEREMLRRALRLARGNKTRAASLLGINRARLHRRLEQLQVDVGME